MKLSKKKIAVILLLTVVMAIVYTMAYYTDQSAKMNTFTTGQVDIIMTEEKYNLPENVKEREVLSPREKVVKDPKITNVGKSDCYVFFEVYMPRTDRVRISTKTKQPLPVEFRNVFLFKNKPEWVVLEKHTMKDPVTNEPFYHYVYAYATGDKTTGTMNVLKKGQSTPTLFVNDVMEYRNFIETPEKLVFEVPVYAYAIQTNDIILTDALGDVGKTDPESVWNVIKAQKNAEERSVKP